MKPFRVGSALTWAKTHYRENILAFITLSAVVTILQFGQQVATEPVSESFDRCFNAGSLTLEAGVIDAQSLESCVSGELPTLLMSFLLVLLFVIAAFLATAGVIRGSLQVSRGMKIGFADTFLGAYFVQFTLTVFIILIVVTAGFFLLIVPAIIAVLFFQFAPFFALDRGYAPFLAVKSSVVLVRRNISLSIVVLLISAAAYLISGLFWGIPTLLVLPIAALVTTYAYRRLCGESVASDPAETLQ